MINDLVVYDDRYRGGVNWTQTMINHANAADIGQSFSDSTYVVDEANPFEPNYAQDSWVGDMGRGAWDKVKRAGKWAGGKTGGVGRGARRAGVKGYRQAKRGAAAAGRWADPRSADMRGNFVRGRNRGQRAFPGLKRQVPLESIPNGFHSEADNWSVGRGLDRGAYGAGYGVGASQRMGQLGRSYGASGVRGVGRGVRSAAGTARRFGGSVVEYGRNDLPEYMRRAYHGFRNAPGQAYRAARDVFTTDPEPI